MFCDIPIDLVLSYLAQHRLRDRRVSGWGICGRVRPMDTAFVESVCRALSNEADELALSDTDTAHFRLTKRMEILGTQKEIVLMKTGNRYLDTTLRVFDGGLLSGSYYTGVCYERYRQFMLGSYDHEDALGIPQVVVYKVPPIAY